MASKKFEKGSPEWEIFQDYWEIYKRFWLPRDGVDYRVELIWVLGDFCKKYRASRFAKEIAVAFDDAAKEKKGACGERGKEGLEKGAFGWNLFRDYYELCQHFWVLEETDEYWEALSNAADAFGEKYKDSPLSKRLMFALVNALEDTK